MSGMQALSINAFRNIAAVARMPVDDVYANHAGVASAASRLVAQIQGISNESRESSWKEKISKRYSGIEAGGAAARQAVSVVGAAMQYHASRLRESFPEEYAHINDCIAPGVPHMLAGVAVLESIPSVKNVGAGGDVLRALLRGTTHTLMLNSLRELLAKDEKDIFSEKSLRCVERIARAMILLRTS